MNVNPYNTTNYENKSNWTLGENKPNSNPNKPNLRNAKMNVNLTLTKDYRKKDDFAVRKNKPNSQNAKNERKLNFNKGLQKKRLFNSPKNKPKTNPISEGPKMSANIFVTTDYENKTALRLQKNKPKQTQFQTAHLLIDRTKRIYYYGIW